MERGEGWNGVDKKNLIKRGKGSEGRKKSKTKRERKEKIRVKDQKNEGKEIERAKKRIGKN